VCKVKVRPQGKTLNVLKVKKSETRLVSNPETLSKLSTAFIFCPNHSGETRETLSPHLQSNCCLGFSQKHGSSARKSLEKNLFLVENQRKSEEFTRDRTPKRLWFSPQDSIFVQIGREKLSTLLHRIWHRFAFTDFRKKCQENSNTARRFVIFSRNHKHRLKSDENQWCWQLFLDSPDTFMKNPRQQFDFKWSKRVSRVSPG